MKRPRWPAFPDLALRRERAPNLVGGRAPRVHHELGPPRSRAVPTASVVIVLDAELTAAEEAALAARRGPARRARHRGHDVLRRAELVLPVTNMAEENGTYVNRDRRIQRFHQAKSQPGMARPAWWVAGEVLAGPGPDADAPSTAEEAFALLGRALAGLRRRSAMPISGSPAGCCRAECQRGAAR